MSINNLIGVIWSGAISYKNSTGYGLVITRDSVVGCRKSPWISWMEAYFGPGSKASEQDVSRAPTVVAELLDSKEFEISKESLQRIFYRAPGHISRGHISFVSDAQEFAVSLPSRSRYAGIGNTLNSLIPSLILFAADRFVDEKTGKLVANEVMEERGSGKGR